MAELLASAEVAQPWLRSCGLADAGRGFHNLVSIAQLGIPLDLMAVLAAQCQRHLPHLSDPDMALNNLERFFRATRSPLALAALFERDEEALPTLLQIFSSSQYLSDLLVTDPEAYDLLRMTEGQPVSRQALVDEICAEVASARDDQYVMTSLRRYKRRETLRIAYGDIIRRQPIEIVTQQIAWLADALCEAAVMWARKVMEQKRGVPRRADGRRARFVVLGLGKLGGVELNYSSDIDLVFLSDGDGQTDAARPMANSEYFERLARHVVKLLTEPTDLGIAYRVDLRLRPEGNQGPMVVGLDAALRYYDTVGRTWERQAFVKARPVAGDLELGHEFLEKLEPWIYRRYLSRADITGIKALKRRIEQRAIRAGTDHRNIKTGHGGIRDIEFVIQFLQLLNGGDLPEIRTGNTLQAIRQLERAGCLTHQESSLLAENYQFLRTVEHRLQIMYDLQTHTLPADETELRRLAIRLGYSDRTAPGALAAFQADLQEKTEVNRRILDHLLHDAFPDAEQAAPETDLVLDPSPPEEMIRQTLAPYGFQDVMAAYRLLMDLASEPIRFLSTRRCRHFLASIAPRLLAAIAATPDPDYTLLNLAKVSDSVGGKGILWELFSFNPATLQLYVRLCASAPYLSGILVSNPGMIDELMDSLVLQKLPTMEFLAESLAELLRNAEDPDPILHSFRDTYHLRVGVRDVLGKDDIRDTHRALSDIAEVIITQVAEREYQRLVARYGEPTLENEDRPCEFIILGMGKLGGREPNYHSDVDVIFLYEGDGETRHFRSLRRLAETTTNQHFFSQLGQRIIRVITHLGPYGRLYDMDVRLRPTGRSGALAVSLAELERYFQSGSGQLWERQALCKARPIYGSPVVQKQTMQVVYRAIVGKGWEPQFAEEIRRMRYRLQESANPTNLKRAPGGTVDVEFAVQMLQLKYAAASPEVLVPGTLEAIAALEQVGYLPPDEAQYLTNSYRFLRGVESRLRLMNTTARHDLPSDPKELRRLAYLLQLESAEQLQSQCQYYLQENRRVFEQLVERAKEN
ncbi:MAG: glutamate-ammonia-ligase adenylyltransferase [Pirellulaceae bacterium]|nr:MAG: glutamate-ammonia-ligase adenylyltransferase [Pirellulaceae bacterium]